jgi:hypothetical protein
MPLEVAVVLDWRWLKRYRYTGMPSLTRVCAIMRAGAIWTRSPKIEHATLSRLPDESFVLPVLYGHPKAGLVEYMLINVDTMSFGSNLGRKYPFAN